MYAFHMMPLVSSLDTFDLALETSGMVCIQKVANKIVLAFQGGNFCARRATNRSHSQMDAT